MCSVEEQFSERVRRLGEEYRKKNKIPAQEIVQSPGPAPTVAVSTPRPPPCLELEVQKLRLDVARLKLINAHLLLNLKSNACVCQKK